MKRQIPKGGEKRQKRSQQGLFCPPGPVLAADLDKALALAAGVFAVPGQRLGDLPFAVRDLSRLLTAERGSRGMSYWAAPRYVAAYLRYFLPWNLYRLACFLPGLDIPLHSGARLLDLGSGPLTMPLALWLARPDIRSLELEIVCADTSPKIMERGRDIFTALAGKNSPWRIRLLRGTAENTLRRQERGSISLLTAGNILNETAGASGKQDRDAARDAASFSRSLAACLAPDGRALLLEPGTRLGGGLIGLCRRAALELGLKPLAPCTQAGLCPLLPEKNGHSGQTQRSAYARKGQGLSWCHFSLPLQKVPEALVALSAKAGLEKERLTCSFLLLARPGKELAGNAARLTGQATALPDEAAEFAVLPDELAELEAMFEEMQQDDALPSRAGARKSGPGPSAQGASAQAGAPASKNAPAFADAPALKGPPARTTMPDEQGPPFQARVLSNPIRLPDRAEPARYVCGAMGLGLLLDAGDLPSGALLAVRPAQGARRDPKSGALILIRAL
ncbi:hypothetical protein LJC15_02925 [Desulfovibrio sp. OttesenSCG-928-G11]|nr:hypothetical protein [Desulfovibrio sp. OttesenSCG-928-G11]